MLSCVNGPMVCTETYRRRVMSLEKPGQGLSVRWEGSLIYDRIYNDKPSGSRFIPILLPGSKPAHIFNLVQGHSYYQITAFDFIITPASKIGVVSGASRWPFGLVSCASFLPG